MNDKLNSEPGLISREIVEETETQVLIRETWDLLAPGCPMIAMRGGRPDVSARVCTRTAWLPRHGIPIIP